MTAGVNARIGGVGVQVKIDGDKVVSYEPFLTGWLKADGKVTGRPVDLQLLPDGSMLVSDDQVTHRRAPTLRARASTGRRSRRGGGP